MIVSLSELKKFLNVPDEDQDPILYDILVRAHSEAESYCDRHFDLSERIEYLAGKGLSSIQLREYPIVESGVFSVSVYDDLDLDFGEDTLIAAAEYQVDQTFGQISLLSSVFQDAGMPNVRNVKVVYGAGFTVASAPNDLKLAILKLAGAGYRKSGTYLNAVSQSTETDGETSDLKKEAEDILDRYKRWR